MNQFNEILKELDTLTSQLNVRKRGKGQRRAFVPKVDFGKKDMRAPAGKGLLFPFMIDPTWLATYNANNDDLQIEDSDPVGFDVDEIAADQPVTSA